MNAATKTKVTVPQTATVSRARSPITAAPSEQSDAVAGPRHRLHDRRLTELAAQRGDGHPDDVRERVGVLVPDLLQQILGGDRLALRAQQRVQDAELLVGQC